MSDPEQSSLGIPTAGHEHTPLTVASHTQASFSASFVPVQEFLSPRDVEHICRAFIRLITSPDEATPKKHPNVSGSTSRQVRSRKTT